MLQNIKRYVLRTLQNFGGVQPQQVHPVPISVKIIPILVPAVKPLVKLGVHLHSNFKMQMCPLPGYSLTRVGRPPQQTEWRPCVHQIINVQSFIHTPKVSVKCVDRQIAEFMDQHDILSVIRGRDIPVDVNHLAGSRRHHRVNGFAIIVPFQALDINALVQARAVVPHTSECSTSPRPFRIGCRKKICLTAVVEQFPVGCGKLKYWPRQSRLFCSR